MRKLTIIALVTLLIILGAGILGVQTMRRREAEREHKRLHEPIVMPEGVAFVPGETGAAELAARLQEKKKVRSARVFREEARVLGVRTIQAGGYVLPKTASPQQLAQIFKAGPTLERVTFPEGNTVGQYATVLQKARFSNASQLRTLAYPSGVAPSKWEGKLFPETYLLPLRAPAPVLAGRMMARWQEIAKSLPRPFPKVNNRELTLDEVTILASLVEREAANDAERPFVASALINRLRKPMRLQCDASVLYGMRRAALANGEELPTVVYSRDYKDDSPFNTYTRDGLPIGAICNPGAASLKAAARPANTPYLFYVLSPASGRHRFAKTFDEHLHNISLARRERAQ